MKIILLFICLCCLNGFSQEISNTETTTHQDSIIKAHPVNSLEAFKREFAEKLNIPTERLLEINQKQLKLIISFLVKEDGKLANAKVLNDKHKLTPEIKGIFESLQNWIPEQQNGKNVASYNTIPIIINISLPDYEISENSIEKRRELENEYKAFYYEFNSNMIYPRDFWERYYYKKGAYDTGANNTSNQFQYLIKFVIDEEGKFQDIETIVNGKYDGYLNKSVKRALAKCTPWEPAVVNNKKVKTYKTLPIVIKIEN